MASPARKFLAPLLAAAALLPVPGRAADVYLDANGVTAGSGNVDTTWDAAAAIWGDALGTATPLAWTAGDIAILAAGTDYTGTRTLTVSGTQVIGGLRLSSSNTGLGTLTVTGGTLDFGATLGSLDFSAWGTTNSKTLNLASTLTGSGGLEIRAFGDLAPGGGGNSSRFNLNGTNTFTGNVTIKSGLVAYSSNAAFGNAANRIILDGGGLLDPNLNITLARDIEVLAGGGTLRAYAITTMTHSGALIGAAGRVINRTDGGTVVHSGDLSGWLGTYNVQRGTTRLDGTSTAVGNWVLGEGTTGATLSFGGSSERRFEGSVTQTTGAASTLRFSGTSRATFAGTATGISTVAVDTTADATISGSLTADTLSMTGQGSILRVVDGANVSFNYLNIGDGTGTSGHILQTGGTFTIRAGNSAAMRLGHWNSSGNRSSLINVSGGTFDASATATLNIGWDGDGDVIVGGGSGAALFKASALQLDANGDSVAYDDTLTILANGTVEVAGSINAASAADRVNLSGGTLRLTAATDTTWGATIAATVDTTSALDVGGRNLTLSSGSHSGSGTVNLSSATGSLIFSNTGNHTLPWGITGSTAITKTGAGTLTYTGTGTHSGAFAVSAGRLEVASGASTTSAVSVASGATIGGKGTIGSLTLSSGAFLNLTALSAGALTTGNLTLSGATLRFDNYGAAATPVSVVTYTGALTGAFGTNLLVEGAANYRSTTFANSAGVVTLDLGTKNLTWSGTGGGEWNIKSATRWNSDTDTFAWGDHVTFSGASTNTSVTLTGELRPGSVTVSGDTNYSLVGGTGNFLAGSMALTKSGASTLTIAGPHTYSGGTVVSQGAIVVGGSSNNALGTGAITLGDASSGANAVSLLLTNARTINNTITVSSQATGSATLGFSGTGGSYTAFEGGIVLQRDLVIQSGTTDRLNFGGVISGTGNVTIQGGQRVAFSNSNTWSGNLTITGAGTVYQTFNNNSLPDTANVTVDSGATFRIYTSDTIAGLNGAGNIRPIAGRPTLTVGSNNTSGDFSGSWTNDGTDHLGLTKIGTGIQTLSGTITSPGDLNISAGILAVSGSGEFSRTFAPGINMPVLGLRGAGTLRVNASGNLTLRRNSDFTGAVEVAGGTLTLGHSNAVNTGLVTLSGGTLAFDNRGSLFTTLSGDVRTGGTLTTHTTTTNYGTLHNTSGDVVPGSTTHVYNGRIYLTTGDWSFAKNFDDGVSITLNGTTVLNNATWNATATGTFNAAADGWYDIEVRAYQGGGGVGPTGGWTKGIGIKKGAATTANADYATFDLAGVASLGGGLVYANDLTFARNIAVSSASTIDTSNLVGTPGSTAVDGNGTGGDLTLSGVISGAGNLTKTGAGTVTLSGVNTHTGRLIISQGRVILPTNSTYRTYAGTQIDIGAATLAVNVGTGDRYDFGAVNYNFTSAGGGAISIGTGVNWVAQGNWTFTTNGGARSTISGAGMNLNQSGRSATFNVARGTDATSDLDVTLGINNTAGGITKSGNGILTLAASSNFSGAATLDAGTLRLTHASALGSVSGITLNGGTLHLATDTAVTSRNFTLGGTGAAMILDRATAGAGFETSMGSITFGSTRTLSVSKGTNVTSGTATLNLTGLPNFGPANNTATFDIGADVLVNISGSVNGTQAFARLAKSGAGTLALAGNNDWWDPASSSGLVTVSGGTLELRSVNALGDGATGTNSIALSLAAGTTVRYASNTALANHSDVTTTGTGATLVLDRASSGAGLTQTLDVLTLAAGTFSVSGGSNIASGTAEALFGAASVTAASTLNVVNPVSGSTLVTLAGVVSGDGSLAKTGNGTLTLSGTNTFSGAIRAESGALNLTGTNRSVASVTAASGATVTLNVTNMFVGGHGTALADSRVLTADGGTLVFGTGFDSRFGNVTLRNGGTLTTNRGTSAWDALFANVVSGAATLLVENTGGNTTAATLNGSGGLRMQGVQNFVINDVTASTAADLVVSAVLSTTGTSGGAAGGINKSGAGTMVLTAANTFAGATTVGAGAIWVGDGSNSTATLGANSSATVSAGATLGFHHNGVVNVSNTLSGAGTVAFRGPGVSQQGDYSISGANAGLTGAVSILSGARVSVNDSADIGTAAVTVASGGQFWANGAITLSNSLAIQGDGWQESAGQLGAIRFSGGTLSGAITLSSNARLTTYLSGDTGTVSGIISGAGLGITKTGAGTLTLSAINTFTGGTTVAGGTLVLNSGGQFGVLRGTVNVESGAILRSSAGDSTGWGTSNQTTAINLNGGEFNVSTTANQTLGNAVITLTGGSITGVAGSNLDFFQGSSALTSSASATAAVVSGVRLSIRQTAGLTITVADGAAADDLRIESVILNNASFTTAPLIKAGAGLLRLTGTNTYTGATTVSNGTLEVGGSGSLGSGSYAGAISNSGSLVFSTSANQTLSGVISGAGSLAKSGAGVLTLGAANTYAGATTVSAGTLRLGAAGSLASSASVDVGASGTFDLNGRTQTVAALTGSGSVTLGSGALTVANASAVSFGGAISGAGSLAKSGAGVLTLSAANTHSGDTTLSSGGLTLAHQSALGSSTLALNGGSVAFSSAVAANAFSLGGLSGAANLALENNAGSPAAVALTVGSNNASTAYSGNLSGSGSLTKTGNGVLTLGGVNDFSGGLTVNGGLVDVVDLASLGAGAVTLGASGTLRLSVTLLGESILSDDFAAGLSGLGTLDINTDSASSLSLGAYAGTFGGTVRVTSGVFDNAGFSGNLVLAGGSLLAPNSFTGTTVVTGAITDVSQLPTGGTLVLDQGGSIDFGETAFAGTILFKGGSVSGSGFTGVLEVDAPNVTVSGSFGQGSLKVGAGKTVNLSGATTGTIVFDGGAITGGANLTGILELGNGQSLVLGQGIDTLGSSATLAVGSGSSVDLAGSSTAATIAFSGGSLTGAQAFTGTLAVSGGATLTTDGTVGGTVTLASGTTLSGNGTFTGIVNAGAGSILAPGSSPGLTTYGELNLTGGSTLQLEFFAAEEEVPEGVETVRGYDTLVATTLNFGTAGDVGGGTILLRLATLTNWSDSADWAGGLGLAPAEGSSLILGPGDMQRDFVIARFDESDRSLTLSDGLNVTSWFTVDSALYVGTGATSYQLFINSGDTTNWELNLRVVPEPSTYGLILGALALAGAAYRRRARRHKLAR